MSACRHREVPLWVELWLKVLVMVLVVFLILARGWMMMLPIPNIDSEGGYNGYIPPESD